MVGYAAIYGDNKFTRKPFVGVPPHRFVAVAISKVKFSLSEALLLYDTFCELADFRNSSNRSVYRTVKISLMGVSVASLTKRLTSSLPWIPMCDPESLYSFVEFFCKNKLYRFLFQKYKSSFRYLLWCSEDFTRHLRSWKMYEYSCLCILGRFLEPRLVLCIPRQKRKHCY